MAAEAGFLRLPHHSGGYGRNGLLRFGDLSKWPRREPARKIEGERAGMSGVAVARLALDDVDGRDGPSSATRGVLGHWGLAALVAIFLLMALGQGSALAAGSPVISEVRALDASQTSVTLEAKIDPEGTATSYHFEWGPTNLYGNQTPVELAGSGTEVVHVSAELTGLSPQTRYHYRLVASGAGEADSGDQELETLDTCGLPEQRCFELVSPPDVGPVATPGQTPARTEMHFQAAVRPGSLAYAVESGFPDATKGAELLYQGDRGPDGTWTSSQLSAPIIGKNEKNSGQAFTSTILGLSEELECGVLESNQPLTADAGANVNLQAGGENLYRLNPVGATSRYTAITALTPIDAQRDLGEYVLGGMSRDCSMVAFTSSYRYLGIPVPSEANAQYSYEWKEGSLENVGIVPGPTGDVPVQATIGGAENNTNAVSADGSKVFFTAVRELSADPGEVGKPAIFVREEVREGVLETRDVSQSETAVPDEGATYQWATADGSKVLFTANAGLTEDSSSAGTDLYEYDLDKAPTDHPLTDLSVDHQPGGAGVAGFVGGSEDGSHVYFLARGQLEPGEGLTFAQNQAAGTYSLYSENAGTITYVAPIGVPGKPGITASQELPRITLQKQTGGESTSRVSPDGSYLLFETRANVTGYEPGNYVPEAYLFDAAAGSTVCVSCRPDGGPSVSLNRVSPLSAGEEQSSNPLAPKRSLVMNDGRPEVFFSSFDALASGAVQGVSNLYEWTHDQVFAIASEPRGLSGPPELFGENEGARFLNLKLVTRFLGASGDGGDYYLATPQSLNWEDGDERASVYDARIGGGFAEPAPPSAPCDPTVEGQCQGSSSPPPAPPSPRSSGFAGPGNPKPKKCKKGQVKKHGKCVKKPQHKKHGKKHTNGKKKHKKNGNVNGGAGK
jgi:hypothetical protein